MTCLLEKALVFPAYSWRPQSPKEGREGYASTVCRLLNHLLVLAKDCQDIQERCDPWSFVRKGGVVGVWSLHMGECLGARLQGRCARQLSWPRLEEGGTFLMAHLKSTRRGSLP